MNFSLPQFTEKSTCQSKFNVAELNWKKVYDGPSADVPKTSHHLVHGTSLNFVLSTSRGLQYLELLNIFFSSKNQ